MNGPSREGALFSAARTAMDEARARRGAADTELGKLEAHLLCLEARDPLASSDYAVAFQLYSAALERDAGNLEAAVMVGESAWYLKEYREGLAALAHALALWDDPAWDRDREDRWLGAILAWTLGNASDGGDADAYGAARERLVRELEAKRAFAAPELLSAAEFLAKAREGMRDCELALALIEEHELERSFAGHPKSASAAGILREIESVCR